MPGRVTTTRRRVHYAWFILAMGVFVVFAALGLGRFGYTAILPSMQKSLGFSNTQAGSLATANLLGYACFALVGGYLAGRFGPRRIITIGLVTVGGGMLLTGLTHGFASAAALRFLTGGGTGLSNVPAMALAASWFSAPRRGLASGVVATGSAVGLVLVGSFVPNLLTTGPDGWRLAWYAYGVVTLIVALVGYLVLRDNPAQKGLHILGATGPLVDDDPAAGLAVTSVPRPTPLLGWGRVYRSGRVWHLGFVYVAFGFSYFLYMTFFNKHLIAAGGYTPRRAGDLLMLLGWCSFVSAVGWGALSDRIGRRATLIIVYLWLATAFAVFGLATTPAGYTLSAVLFGAVAWAVPTIMAAACGDAVGPRLAPAALGLATALFAVGQALGPAVAGVIADSTGGFAPAFLLAAGVAALGVVAAAFLPRASTPAGHLSPNA